MSEVNTQFTTRQMPWMQLGTVIEQPIPAAEAAKLADLDFDVRLEPSLYRSQSGEIVESGDRYHTVRNDTEQSLGVVSDRYEVVQYHEAFTFIDSINPNIMAAGALQNGKQAFMVVQFVDMPTMLEEIDPHDLYVVLRSSHNGSRAIEVAVLPVRNKCMNGLTLKGFMNGAKQSWSIVHVGDPRGKLAEAQSAIKNTQQYVGEYTRTVTEMINKEINDDIARKLLDRVIEKHLKSRDEVKERIIDMRHNDPTIGFDGTAWNLLNSLSSYYEWERSLGTPVSRFLGELQGPAHKMINGLQRELARV